MSNGLTPGITFSDVIKYLALPGLFGYSLPFFGATLLAYCLAVGICFMYWVFITGVLIAGAH